MSGEPEILYGLNASLTAAAVSAGGIAAMAFFKDWAGRNSVYFSAFAVGLLTVAVLFHLTPEALEASPLALGWIAAGFAFMVLAGIGVQTAVGGEPEGAALAFGYASIIGLASHSFFDGAIYAASFHDDAFTGWIATGGLIFHEFPEGVIAFSLLAGAGLSRVNAAALALAAAGLTTVAGAVAANVLLNLYSELPVSAMLGAAAGALIYVVIVHLGPHAAKTPNKRGYELAMLGVVVGTAAILFDHLGGGHAH